MQVARSASNVASGLSMEKLAYSNMYGSAQILSVVSVSSGVPVSQAVWAGTWLCGTWLCGLLLGRNESYVLSSVFSSLD
eukprot:1159066-Pelagomonas_calceolata.AAC.11